MDMEVTEGLTEFYDSAYSKTCSGGFRPGRPHPEVVEALKHTRRGRGLDIGCGLGRNTLFLARAGFKMKAIDLSKKAIGLIQAIAEEEGLSIEAVAGSITQELLLVQYSLIVNTFVLDHFVQDEAHGLVRRMQEKTRAGGINVVTTFAHDPDYIAIDRRHYFKPEELTSLYSGWKILSSKISTNHEMNVPHDLKVIRVVAQKPR